MARIFVNKEGERSAEEGMPEGGREGVRLVHRDGGDVVDISPNTAEEEEKLRENMREGREGGKGGTPDFDWQLRGENVSQHPEPRGSNKTPRIYQHVPALLFMRKTGTRQAPDANPASALHIYKSSLNCFSPARNKASLCSRHTRLN